jgi:D-alanyl-lipoteichoic acid acyltransferase DltB (MBOAT superfamily)
MPFNFISNQARQLSCGQNLNMTFLRLLSFSFDLRRGNESSELAKHQVSCPECAARRYCLKGRNYLEPENYGFLNFFNYILFAPTLLAGPPISYKNYISFQKNPSSKSSNFQNFFFILLSF